MVSQVEYKRKFLVVIDETEECDRALTFAAWRVKRTGGTVVLMTVIPKPEFIGLGVEDVLRAEAVEEAERNLDRRMARIKEIGEVRAESVIREGNGAEQIERVIDKDHDYRHSGAGRLQIARWPGSAGDPFCRPRQCAAHPPDHCARPDERRRSHRDLLTGPLVRAKSVQWTDFRSVGHENYARMADPLSGQIMPVA